MLSFWLWCGWLSLAELELLFLLSTLSTDCPVLADHFLVWLCGVGGKTDSDCHHLPTEVESVTATLNPAEQGTRLLTKKSVFFPYDQAQMTGGMKMSTTFSLMSVNEIMCFQTLIDI